MGLKEPPKSSTAGPSAVTGDTPRRVRVAPLPIWGATHSHPQGWDVSEPHGGSTARPSPGRRAPRSNDPDPQAPDSGRDSAGSLRGIRARPRRDSPANDAPAPPGGG